MPLHKQRGFSLIEIVIVLAILLILVAVAYSYGLNARSHADEASAQESLRVITAAEFDYAYLHPDVGFTSLLDNLDLTDSSLKSGYKHGYEFSISVDPNTGDTVHNHFQVTAMPTGLNELLPTRTYYADETGIIRFAWGREPSASSLKIHVGGSQ